MRRIQRVQPSPHVQGRYLVFFEGEKLLKVTEDEMLRFSRCACLALEEDTYAELTRCASRSQAMPPPASSAPVPCPRGSWWISSPKKGTAEKMRKLPPTIWRRSGR